MNELLNEIYEELSFMANADAVAIGRLNDNLEKIALLMAKIKGARESEGPTCYSQRDTRWASDPMGVMGGTLGAYGCWVTAVASCRTDAGEYITPAQLNAYLNANGGYVDGANLASCEAPVQSSHVLAFARQVFCEDAPAPLDEMRTWLAAGHFIVVMVDANPDADVDTHFVRLLSVEADGSNGRIMDSWDGQVVDMCPRYRGLARWGSVATAREAILRVVYYQRVSR